MGRNEAGRLICTLRPDLSGAVADRPSITRTAARVVSAGKEFGLSSYGDISAFFDDTAKDYDLFLENPYWSFCNELLERILERVLKRHFDGLQPIRFLDAGAGTGTWSRFLLGMSNCLNGVLLDMNISMLKIAHRKVAMTGQENRVQIREGNLEFSDAYPVSKSNLILCLHNVIGMGRNTDAILKNIAKHLEPNGLAVIMAPNKCHAYNFNMRSQNLEEVRRVLNHGTVKFKADMPEMFCYTPDEFQARLCAAGFDDVVVLGFPVTQHPDLADPHLRALADHTNLRDPSTRRSLLRLELELCFDPALANRAGDGLLAVCQKRSDADVGIP